MLRTSVARWMCAFALAPLLGAAIGLAAVAAWAASGAPAGQSPRPQLAAAIAPAPLPDQNSPVTSPAPDSSRARPVSARASAVLTVEQAQTVANHVSPGTVVQVDQDSEPTGLVYDVKVQHADGSETKVKVDAVTGKVVRIKVEGGDGH